MRVCLQASGWRSDARVRGRIDLSSHCRNRAIHLTQRCRTAAVERYGTLIGVAIHVIVDTTELYRTPLLDAAGWKELLARSRRGEVRLCVPEVVLREASRHYRERIGGDLMQAQKALAKLRDLGFAETPDLQATEPQVTSLAEAYRPQLERLLSQASAYVLPLPSVSHEELLDRDLEIRKPFRQSGKGYRDALIWEAILEYADTCHDESTFYFVTSNTSDYCDSGESKLARVLQHEFEARSPNVSIVRTESVAELINDTLREYFGQHDERYAEMDAALAEPTLAETIGDAVVAASERLVGEAVSDLQDNVQRVFGALLFDDVTPPEATEVTVTAVEPSPDSVDFSIYDQYEGDTVALHACVEAIVEFEAYIDKQLADDYDRISHDWDESDDDGWDERTVLVDFSRRVRLWFDIVAVGSEVETVAFDYAEAA